jgi:hypothetical protein
MKTWTSARTPTHEKKFGATVSRKQASNENNRMGQKYNMRWKGKIMGDNRARRMNFPHGAGCYSRVRNFFIFLVNQFQVPGRREKEKHP